jgi:DNA-nicking Smr family endonuclease
MHAEEPVEIKIGDTLDLHTFRPAEVGDLLPEYFRACLEKGILQVRVIHGKGTGALKRRVHGILERDPRVASFTDAPADAGGWGATLVNLKKYV